jgi:hypothetical protein
MSNPRFDDILSQYAKKHAPIALQRAPQDDTRLIFLATALAKQGVLVLWTDVPATHRMQQAELINEWISTYGNFYRLLTEILFPSLIQINATYADKLYPPIVILEGDCSPIMEAFAHTIVPYIARHQRTPANVAEIQGVLNFMLEDVEGTDIATAVYRDILAQGTRYITHLMALPLEQKTLTFFSRPHFQQLGALPQDPSMLPPAPSVPAIPETPKPKPVTGTLTPPPPTAPEIPKPKPVTGTLTPPPPTAPETPKPKPVTGTLTPPPPTAPETPKPKPLGQDGDTSSIIPIFFETRNKANKPPRQPPVPPLPKKD